MEVKMEEVFHGIKIDKTELQRVKDIKKAKSKTKELVETEDFIPFSLSDDEDCKEEEANGNQSIKEEQEQPEAKSKKSKKEKKTSAPPVTKRIRIDSLLYKDMPWIEKKRKYSQNTTLRLHQEIVDFVNWMGPTEEERFARASCVERVRALVANCWPDATLETFGSVRTQFYVPSSDIDLVVMFANENKKAPLKRFANLLRRANIPEEGSLQVISKARVPIIKYIDRISAYPVDVSFNVTSGTESGDLVSRYSAQYPALRPLTLLLKHFLEMRGLNEVYTGGIGSYTVTCLVLSFLQTHPLIQANLIRPHENLGIMLLEILELYGKHFNYDHVAISVNPLVKGEFYFDKAERGWVNENRPGLLAIEDPQNRDNDISKGSFSFYQVRQAFEHGHSVLVSAMAEYEAVVLDRHKKSDPNLLSILSSIIRISDQLLRHRHYVQSTTNI